MPENKSISNVNTSANTDASAKAIAAAASNAAGNAKAASDAVANAKAASDAAGNAKAASNAAGNAKAASDAAGNAKAASDATGTGTNPAACCTQKRKERTKREYKDLINRLNRIEGQVRGIKGMVEKDAYCTDILVQVSAVNAALNSFNKALLANHIKTCVIKDIREGKEDTVDELVTVLQKLMK